MLVTNDLKLVVMLAFGTLVFLASLASLHSAQLFQRGSRTVAALCVSVLAVMGLFGIPVTNRPAGASDLTQINGVAVGILCLYASMALTVLFILLFLLPYRWLRRTLSPRERQSREKRQPQKTAEYHASRANSEGIASDKSMSDHGGLSRRP